MVFRLKGFAMNLQRNRTKLNVWLIINIIVITVYTRIFRAYFFWNLAKKNWGACIIWNKVGTAAPPNKMIPSHVKEWSANHVLSRVWLQDLIITRSQQKKSLG